MRELACLGRLVAIGCLVLATATGAPWPGTGSGHAQAAGVPWSDLRLALDWGSQRRLAAGSDN